MPHGESNGSTTTVEYKLGDAVEHEGSKGMIAGITRWAEGFMPQTDYVVLCDETLCHGVRAESLRPAAWPF